MADIYLEAARPVICTTLMYRIIDLLWHDSMNAENEIRHERRPMTLHKQQGKLDRLAKDVTELRAVKLQFKQPSPVSPEVEQLMKELEETRQGLTGIIKDLGKRKQTTSADCVEFADRIKKISDWSEHAMSRIKPELVSALDNCAAPSQ